MQPSDLVGKTLSHYFIVEKIGAGGMGVVYRAHDQHLECDVAIKVLPAGVLDDEDARKRFRREALALSKLNHPNIEVAHDFDTQEGLDFLVTEYIPGQTLDAVLASRLPEEEILALGTQLAEGLAAAHEQGVIHRDLKPSNLQVTEDGRLKILDFGLAKKVQPPSPTAPTESLTLDTVGTLPYMSPEQLRRQRADARSDLWAAGTVLYEMATRQRPFLGSGLELADAIRYLAPLPPRTLNPEISPGLDAVILHCLEKDPDLRYQSARELAMHLRRLAKGEAPWPLPAPHARPAFARSVRARIIFLAMVLAVGVALALPASRHWVAAQVVAVAHRTTGSPPKPPPALPAAPSVTEKDQILVTEFRNRTGDPVFEATLRKAVALDLDQSPYLNVVSDWKVAEALKLMGRDPEEKLTPELGAELCQRDGIKALLVGSLDRVGGNYLLSLQVIEAATGEVLAVDQESGGQQEVLRLVDQAASKLRERLGESLASIHKFEKPLPEATTSSLEALRAFALGDQKHYSAYEIEAIGLYRRALALDPNFALAWARLAVVYGNLGDQPDAEDAARHAFALKDRVSERERLYILASSSDLTERRAILELYHNTYPRDSMPYLYLSEIDPAPQAEKDLLRTLQLDPGVAVAYGDLAEIYVGWGRMAEAMNKCREGLRRVAGAPLLAAQCYEFALAAHDAAALQQSADALQASAEGRFFLAQLERDRAFAQGQVRQSREKNEAMLAVMQASHLPSLLLAKVLPWTRLQLAAGYQVPVAELLRAYPGLAARSLPALLALVEAGEAQAAEAMKAQVLTGSNQSFGPYVDGLLAFRRGQTQPTLALLRSIGQIDDPFVLWHRGSIYLRSGLPGEASADFNKLLEQARPSAPLYPWAPFAHIGLARCAARQGNKPAARAEYEKAFTLWKDADPDIPLLQQAKAEYAQVH